MSLVFSLSFHGVCWSTNVCNFYEVQFIIITIINGANISLPNPTSQISSAMFSSKYFILSAVVFKL